MCGTDFELPPARRRACESSGRRRYGQVVYLTRNGEAIAAIVPADVAAAGAAAIEALKDAADLQAARAARGEPGPTIPLADVLAKYGDDLAAYPNER